MTGYDVIRRAFNLLGYLGDGQDPCTSDKTAANGFGFINQLLSDLKCHSISSLQDSLGISSAKEEALCYGVAMLFALTEGDGNKNRIFSEIYNAKRGIALAEISGVKDVLPKVTAG